jgi:hypothetical protein
MWYRRNAPTQLPLKIARAVLSRIVPSWHTRSLPFAVQERDELQVGKVQLLNGGWARGLRFGVLGRSHRDGAVVTICSAWPRERHGCTGCFRLTDVRHARGRDIRRYREAAGCRRAASWADEPFQHLDIDVPLWHGEFHMIPDLPKALVADRQAIYSRHFFNVGTNDNRVITDADVEHYANAYRDPDHLRSAFEVYRALPANITLNAGSTATVDVPLLLVGGEHVFGPVMPALAENLRAHHGWTDVRVEILKNGGTTCPRSDPTRSPSSSSATPRTGNGPERASRRNGALPDVPTSSPIRSSSPPSPCITSRPDSRTPPGH